MYHGLKGEWALGSGTTRSQQIHNHSVPTLSELDMQMIKHVPPGGNWQHIPESVPSKRLDQIRETSRQRGIVRTSYYGRLRPDQPAYTISTFFNRPGNGTNIHPWEHRTLSCREAARIQSFPDSFVFHGSEGAVRKQIGNAVPPLLAYAVGKSIGPIEFVDLFAGAGGLSHGLELAGLTGLVAQEIDNNAVKTYRENHASVDVLEGDIRDRKIQDRLVDMVRDKLGKRKLGLLAGGPPCQGFSTAGWRDENDERNALVAQFLRLVERLQPIHVLIENVEGLLSMGKGSVLRGILEILNDLGYTTYARPWVLNAEQYGVPQMRRRVMIVAVEQGRELPGLPTPYFDKCLGRRETMEHRLNPELSYPVTVSEALRGLPSLTPIIEEYFVDMASVDPSYSQWIMGETHVEDFLRSRGKQAIRSDGVQQLALL